MSETPETIDAILAEMRSARNAESDMTLVQTDWLTQWADRIEAAAERERNEDRQLAAIAESDEAFARCARCDRPEHAPGDTAAMRDLLEKIRHEYGWGRIGCRTCVSSEADVERVCDLFEKQIEAALSAPARNCDKMTEEEALAAWEKYRHSVPLPRGGWDFRHIVKWLYANAEGGDHA